MKIHIINLDRSPDRWQFMRKQVELLGLSVERCAAVDGESLQLTSYPNSPLTAGEIGCFLSHRKIWKQLLVSDDNYAVVLEDDVHLSPQLPTILSDIAWIPKDAAVVKLDTSTKHVGLDGKKLKAPTNRVLRRLLSKHTGTAGYIIERQAAKRLNEAAETLDEPVDDFMFGDIAVSTRIIYQLSPAAVQQHYLRAPESNPEIELSLITEGRQAKRAARERPPLPQLIIRETIRPLRRLRDRIIPRLRLLGIGHFVPVDFQ